MSIDVERKARNPSPLSINDMEDGDTGVVNRAKTICEGIIIICTKMCG